MTSKTPRLRFAPSPTGPLHLGGARTALYNLAAARSLGGSFVLRIEDTDRARSTDESLRVILEGLRWLGIDWDEGPEFDGCGGGDFGPYFQMQRLDRYREVADRLLASGHAYRCYCSPERIEAVRAEQKARKSPFLGYDGRCRDLDEAQRAEFEREGVEPSLRFRMPKEGSLVVSDLIRSDSTVELRQLDDWVMMRPDGVPLYNFACVVDDLDMRITHVLRGEEHKMNGVKQVLLFEALGAEPPLYGHIPLILNAKGGKLSKRDPGVMSVLEYRDRGYPAEAVFNYIALLGWGFSGDRDLFTRDEMFDAFRIENVGKAGAKFDLEKMHWMCGEYLRRHEPSELVERAMPWLAPVLPDGVRERHAAWLENAVACYRERITLLSDLPEKLGWLFGESVEPDAAAAKNLAKYPDAKRWLSAYADLLEGMPLPPSLPDDRTAADLAVRLPSKKDTPEPECSFATPAAIEARTRVFAEELGVKFGHLVHPVRAALTGTNKGPGLFDVVFLLGGRLACRRLRAAAG